jgi:hypothetical protein
MSLQTLTHIDALQHALSHPHPPDNREAGFLRAMQQDARRPRLAHFIGIPSNDWLPALLEEIARAPPDMPGDIRRYLAATRHALYSLDQLDALASALAEKYTPRRPTQDRLDAMAMHRLNHLVAHAQHGLVIRVTEETAERLRSQWARRSAKRAARLERAGQRLSRADADIVEDVWLLDRLATARDRTRETCETATPLWAAHVKNLYAP